MPPEPGRVSDTCAVTPSKRSCKVSRKPVFMAKATTSVATPAATPITENAVTRRNTAGRCGDRKYRLATNHSNFMLDSPLRRSRSSVPSVRAAIKRRHEATLPFRGIIQFRNAIGDFHSGDVDLEALGDGRILRLLLGQRRNVRRELVENRRLHELIFRDGLEQQPRPFAVG